MPRRKTKMHYLKRPCVIAIGFSGEELDVFKTASYRSGLSIVEYGRRKILDIPIVDIPIDTPEAFKSSHSARFTFRFSKTELRELRARSRKVKLSDKEYGRRKILGIPIAAGEPSGDVDAAIGAASQESTA